MFIPHAVGEDPSLDGAISFQPNVIPDLQIHFVEEVFRFQWLNNKFDLKLLVAYNDKTDLKFLSLKDLAEKDKSIKQHDIINKATESMYEFGYMIEDIPQEIADNCEYLVWKIEDASFSESEIEVEEIEVFEDVITPYNITRFHLPDNLILSYEDLWLYNFTVKHPNKLETKVENVKGKTSWNLDPITFSGGIITWSGTVGAWDFWNASNVNGWNAVQKLGDSENTQYVFGCRVQGTNGVTSWWIDTDIQIMFNSTSVTATYQNHVRLLHSNYVRWGQLDDDTEKRTSEGISVISNSSYAGTRIIRGESGASRIYLYSTSIRFIHVSSLKMIENYGSGEIYNCRFEGFEITRGAWNIYNLDMMSGTHAFENLGSSTIDKLTVYDISFRTINLEGTNTVTISNLKARNNVLLLFCRAITVDSYLINPDIDTWNTEWYLTSTGEIYRQYEFDLNVTDSSGVPIQNVNVTVTYEGQNGAQAFTILTGSNGSFTTKTLSMGFYNQTGGNSLYDYNPYNITATLDGYQTYSTLLNITQQEDLTIGLTEETEATYNWFAATIIIAFFACFMTIYALTGKT